MIPHSTTHYPVGGFVLLGVPGGVPLRLGVGAGRLGLPVTGEKGEGETSAE